VIYSDLKTFGKKLSVVTMDRKIKIMKKNFWQWLAWKLPEPLIYWSYIRLVAFVTSTEQYRNTEPDKISVMDALKRAESFFPQR
jgi:hypothetical protein